MPKRLNPKCQVCAQLPAARARLLHGEDGDSCWDDRRCHNRRSFYRRRTEQENLGEDVKRVAIAPPEVIFAVLYLYKESGDKPLHALGAELWRRQRAICWLEPVHCFGLTASQIRLYSEQVLQAFSQEAGVNLSQFKELFELSPQECPIRPCPLHPEVTE